MQIKFEIFDLYDEEEILKSYKKAILQDGDPTEESFKKRYRGLAKKIPFKQKYEVTISLKRI